MAKKVAALCVHQIYFLQFLTKPCEAEALGHDGELQALEELDTVREPGRLVLVDEVGHELHLRQWVV